VETRPSRLIPLWVTHSSPSVSILGHFWALLFFRYVAPLDSARKRTTSPTVDFLYSPARPEFGTLVEAHSLEDLLLKFRRLFRLFPSIRVTINLLFGKHRSPHSRVESRSHVPSTSRPTCLGRLGSLLFPKIPPSRNRPSSNGSSASPEPCPLLIPKLVGFAIHTAFLWPPITSSSPQLRILPSDMLFVDSDSDQHECVNVEWRELDRVTLHALWYPRSHDSSSQDFFGSSGCEMRSRRYLYLQRCRNGTSQ